MCMFHSIVGVFTWAIVLILQPPSRAEVKSVKSAIHRLADSDASVMELAQRELQDAPSDLVVPELVSALTNNPAFRDETIRFVSYALLRDHRAAQIEVGYQQLLHGLNEPRAVPVLSALMTAPVEKRAEVAASIARLLTQQDRTDAELTKGLEILAKSAAQAGPHLGVVKALFDDDARSTLVREYAAFAVIRVGGLKSALQHFAINEPKNHASIELIAALRGLMMGAHASVTSGNDGIYHFFPEASVEEKQALQRIVVGALEHKDATIRMAAMEALWPAFGNEYVVEQDSGMLEINPVVLAAVRSRMLTDPDESVRAEARRLVADGGFQRIVDDFQRAKRRAAAEAAYPVSTPP